MYIFLKLNILYKLSFKQHRCLSREGVNTLLGQRSKVQTRRARSPSSRISSTHLEESCCLANARGCPRHVIMPGRRGFWWSISLLCSCKVCTRVNSVKQLLNGATRSASSREGAECRRGMRWVPTCLLSPTSTHFTTYILQGWASRR